MFKCFRNVMVNISLRIIDIRPMTVEGVHTVEYQLLTQEDDL